MKFFKRIKSADAVPEESAVGTSEPIVAKKAVMDPVEGFTEADFARMRQPAPPAPALSEPDPIAEALPTANPPVSEPVISAPEVPEPAIELLPDAPETEAPEVARLDPVLEDVPATAPAADLEKGLLSRMRQGLSRTSDNLFQGLGNLFLGRKEIDEELLEELESHLLMADVGVDATRDLIGALTERVSRSELTHPQALQSALREELLALLQPCQQPLDVGGKLLRSFFTIIIFI